MKISSPLLLSLITMTVWMLDVAAMYLVSPIAIYSAALANSPLHGSNWHTMNVPLFTNKAWVTVRALIRQLPLYQTHTASIGRNAGR